MQTVTSFLWFLLWFRFSMVSQWSMDQWTNGLGILSIKFLWSQGFSTHGHQDLPQNKRLDVDSLLASLEEEADTRHAPSPERRLPG